MPFCRKCGNQLDDQALFCPKCGAPVSVPVSPPYVGARRRTSWYVPAAIIGGVIAFALILVVVFAFLGNPLGSVVGSGNVVTQDRQFSGFSSVGVSSGFEFVITQSSTYRIRTITDDNIQDYIQISQTDSTLSIGLKPGYGITTSTLRVEISMPSLNQLELSGGAHGRATGFVSTGSFVLEASGGSTVQMAGQANDLTIDGSGGSQLDLSDFAVGNANVNLSGGATADINADGTINANLSGGSRLYYSGNPVLGSINVSGGSSIERRSAIGA